MPEEQKTAETEQERLADFPRDLSRSFTYLHRQRKKYSVKNIWMTVCAATAL